MTAYRTGNYGPRRGIRSLGNKGRTVDEIPLTDNQLKAQAHLEKHPGVKAAVIGRLEGILPNALATSWANAALRGLARRNLAHRKVSGLWYPGPEPEQITE